MSKRLRFVIIIALLVVAGIFLYPTISWYWLIDQKMKDISTATQIQLRDYAGKKAVDGVSELKALLKQPYTAMNIKDKISLAGNLKESKKPIYQFLRDKLKDQTKSLLASYSLKEEPQASLVGNLVSDLNQIVNGSVFYDPTYFKDIPLTKAVSTAAGDNYTRTDTQPGAFTTLNKILLEESFPNEIIGNRLPDEYKTLSKKIDDYYRSVKKKAPDVLTITAAFQSMSREVELKDTLEDHFRADVVAIKDTRSKIIQLGLDLVGGMRVTIRADFEGLAKDTGQSVSSIDKKAKMKNVLEILNQRIDKFGVSEPVIRQQGDDKIIVELPGLADPERIRKVILGKGRLNFNIVDAEATQKALQYIQQNPTDYLSPDGKSLKDPTIIPKGDVLLEVVEKDKYGLDQRKGYSVINTEKTLSGEYVQSAAVQQDPNSFMKPNVTFSLSTKGGDIFYKLTQENVKKSLAVVLDDKVKFQATINEPIHSQVQVSGQGISGDEASDLALLLRTGALPVPLEIAAQEQVGASLGEDAINQALLAGFIGICLVAFFMLVYYKGGGLNADIGLLLNFPLILGVLSVFHFTLTLPGIAAFVLNIGMAVDANVIIFERIKEEYRAGKSRTSAIKSGFEKAFLTIFDSNLTTIFAAIALGIFGKGSVQGFAIVLMTGIVCSMFTAVFVSRLIFDFFTDNLKPERISLGWRRLVQ
jgi:preprotein translocase subunit SecD